MYRINSLLKEKNRLFHTSDLALLWEMKNKNSLYTTIKRYVQKGILIPIHKGFYSTVSPQELNPLILIRGCLHRFCYLSCETVLFNHGVIFQKSNFLTIVSFVSKKVTLASHDYLIRKLKDEFLYNLAGINEKDGIYIAELDRAVSDMQYFNPDYFFDNRKEVNWKRVKELKIKIGY